MAPAMIVWGPGFKTAKHRHHCVQLLMALRGTLLVRSGREKGWRKCGAVWVRPDATHEVDARGSTLLLGFISAESDMGAALSARIDGEIACVPAGQVARWRAVLGPTPSDARTERWLTEFVPRGRGVEIHAGVRRVLSYRQRPRAVLDDLSLKTLAGIACLSPSRFMHAFTESVGVPVRPYIRWAPAPAGGLRLEEQRHRHGRGPSRRLLGRRSPHAHVSSHARRDTVGPRFVEKGEPGVCARVRRAP